MSLKPRAQRLFSQIGPIDQGDVAAALCDVLAMHQEDVEAWFFQDTDGNPGGSILLDIDRTPAIALDWAGQLGGVRPDASVTDPDEKRRRIKESRGRQRGRLSALISELQTTLTGTKSVRAVRGASVFEIAFITLASETPDPDASLAAVTAWAVEPLGYKLSLFVVDGWTLDEFEAAFATLDAAEADFVTLYDLEVNDPVVAPSLRSQRDGGALTGSTATIAYPSGTADGDTVMVEFLCVDSVDLTGSLTTPAGWTRQGIGLVNGYTWAIYTVPYTMGLADFSMALGASRNFGISAHAIRDTAGVDVFGQTTTASPTAAAVAPSVTTTMPGCLLMYGCIPSIDGETITVPAGFTPAAMTTIVRVGTKAPVNSGPRGTLAGSVSISARTVSFAIAFKPASS